jgi:hypothetical protein
MLTTCARDSSWGTGVVGRGLGWQMEDGGWRGRGIAREDGDWWSEKNPHPNPLPEHRERGPEWSEGFSWGAALGVGRAVVRETASDLGAGSCWEGRVVFLWGGAFAFFLPQFDVIGGRRERFFVGRLGSGRSLIMGRAKQIAAAALTAVFGGQRGAGNSNMMDGETRAFLMSAPVLRAAPRRGADAAVSKKPDQQLWATAAWICA